ncbi:MAG: hypothetical protein AAB510_02600 [Patescibacteria group bacterium]
MRNILLIFDIFLPTGNLKHFCLKSCSVRLNSCGTFSGLLVVHRKGINMREKGLAQACTLTLGLGFVLLFLSWVAAGAGNEIGGYVAIIFFALRVAGFW